MDEMFKIKGHVTATIRDAKTGLIKRVYEYDNLITTVGRGVLAQRLASTNTYTGNINYGALGTNVTPPANSDTQLGTETYRKATSSYIANANIAYLSFFYSASETTGSYKEFGTFIDGTAVANSGQIFTHVAVDITKTSSETLTIDVTYTIS